MTTTRVDRNPSPLAALCIALSCATLGLASCKHDPDVVTAFIVGSDQLQAALCMCRPHGFECESGSIASACEEGVLREHSGEMASWLDCAAHAMHARAQCIQKAGCSDQALESCDQDLDDVCGDAPKQAAEAIDREFDRLCIEPIRCEDGTRANGRICNGTVECSDFSDEAGCDGDSSSGSTSSGSSSGSAGAASATPPPPTKPPPSIPVTPPPVSAGPPSFAGPSDMCVAATPVIPPITLSCIRCGCAIVPGTVVACDKLCWSLIACVLDNCPTLTGSPEQTQCVVNECSQFISGASAATALGTVLGQSCSGLCPPF